MDSAAKQAIAAAWDQFLADTDEARRQFDAEIRAAGQDRDVTAAHLHAEHQVGLDRAWHDYNDRYSDAWAAYQQATNESRLARDYAIDQATPRALPAGETHPFAIAGAGD